MTVLRYYYLLLLSLLMVSCGGGGGNIKINGEFAGYGGKTVSLYRIVLDSEVPVDTVVTDERGRFAFRFKPEGDYPVFYNLRYDAGGFAMLLSPGEKVKLNSLGNYARNYTVEGSAGSQQVKELNRIMGASFSAMDSLSRRLGDTYGFDVEERERIYGEYATVYIHQKQEMIKFIVNNSTSMASLYALYQRMPNGDRVFDRGDLLYMKLVHDSLSTRYPQSPNVLSLQKDIEHIENASNLGYGISSAMASAVPFPDINLPDMYGNRVRLSSIKDKVILLDFWTTDMPGSAFHNAELMELYTRFFDKGFEIYQVSLDVSKSAWVGAIAEQKLPWISVCDFLGANSPAAGSYNITSLPTNILIDREGNIVARDVTLEAVAELITN